MREDFTSGVKDTLARRAGMRCSNPACRKLTVGPQDNPSGTINIGVAAHITAASPGGPRYDTLLPSEWRRAMDNGIWLCQNCSKVVDSDPERFTVEVLDRWKQLAEANARLELESNQGSSVTDAPHVPLSVKELIGVVDIRADAIAQEMT